MRATRERILHAALGLFIEKGLEETTISEITRAADVGKGTFFTYFPNKESVLAHVAELLVERMEASARAARAGGGTVHDTLKALFRPGIEWHEANPELSRFLGQAFLRHTAYAEADRSNVGRLATLIAAEVADAQTRGELTRTVPVVQAAIAIFGTYFGSIAAWHIDQRSGGLAALFDGSLGIVIRGLRR